MRRDHANTTPAFSPVAAVLRQTIAFDAPHRLASLLAGFARPWCVAGGWALDLFLQTKTRPHGDIEMLIFREDQLALQQHLLGDALSLTGIVPPPQAGIEQPWPPGEPLDTSIHQVRARSSEFEFDIFIADTDGDRWIYRRDRRVARPRAGIGSISALRVPFLVPEIVLLFKAKNPLPKDWVDFARIAPHLPEEAKLWLKWAIELAHPLSPWTNSDVFPAATSLVSKRSEANPPIAGSSEFTPR